MPELILFSFIALLIGGMIEHERQLRQGNIIEAFGYMYGIKRKPFESNKDMRKRIIEQVIYYNHGHQRFMKALFSQESEEQ